MRGCDLIRCGQNAECVEDPRGEGSCRCVRGFTGDGITCRPETTEQTCETLRCPEGTRCNYNSEGRLFCEATQGSCQELDCDANARCVIEQIPGQEAALPRCICNDGFNGDPNDLEAGCTREVTCKSTSDCSPGLVCQISIAGTRACLDPCQIMSCPDGEQCRVVGERPVCQCRPGHSKNKFTGVCQPVTGCSGDNDCR